MKINGYEYSREEIFQALRKKDYLIVPFRTYTETHIHGSRFKEDWFDTYVAIKEWQNPSDEYIWSNVAKREFTKEISKPDLD